MSHLSSQEHSPSDFTPKSKRLASDRWKILRENILSSCSEKKKSRGQIYGRSSVRSFSSFGLFTVTEHIPVRLNHFVRSGDDSKENQKTPLSCIINSRPTVCADKWVHYKASVGRSAMSGIHEYTIDSPVTTDVIVKLVSRKQSLVTLIGFNNTGNVCVWPAEEVMAYYCLKHLEMFQGANVCEVGGGMTSLSALLLASTHVPSKILLTDGNQRSVDNVLEIITANDCLLGVDVSAEVVVWDQSFLGKPSVHDSSFDYVLCADCLFFTNIHSELVQVIFKLLKFHGEALIFAPKRNGSLEQFCSVADEYFEIQTVTKYDDIVWLKHIEATHKEDGCYKVDIHYPVMILLRKIQRR